jgi:hypothetical protein
VTVIFFLPPLAEKLSDDSESSIDVESAPCTPSPSLEQPHTPASNNVADKNANKCFILYLFRIVIKVLVLLSIIII